MNYSKNIKSIREQFNYSRKKLSELTGISAGYIEEIESGKKVPTIEKLLQLSSAFNITVSDLIGETEFEQIPNDLQNIITSAKLLTPEQLNLLNKFISSITRDL